MAEVALLGVSKAFDGAPVLSELSLLVPDGAFCVVLGPSGCGKSTLLRLVAGLEKADRGQIRIGGRDVTALPPRARNVGMVFQNYALYPHMTVAENIGLPLRLRKRPAPEIARRVHEVASRLGLGELLGRLPRQLSGGQRQRVALGRAIAHEPQCYLFDEPLSNVDALLRLRMRAQIAELWRSLAATLLYVTHDQTEALALGSLICVLDAGRIQQIGSARDLYDRPANRFVAGFVGSPAINLIPGRLRFSGDLLFDPWAVPVPPGSAAALKERQGRDIVLGVRPEDITAREEPDVRFSLKGEVERTEYLGSVCWVTARVEGVALVAGAEKHARFRPGQPVHLTPDRERLHWFDPVSGLRV